MTNGIEAIQLTERLALAIASFQPQTIPVQGREIIKKAIIDYVGVTLAGFGHEKIKRLCDLAQSGSFEATIWGTGDRTSAHLAAMANGAAAHVLELDDINQFMVAHPSAQLLPGLLALAESRGKTGQDIITAYFAGFETGMVIARAINPQHIRRGWFAVGTLGPIMQAAGCARLLGLSPRQATMALGLAANCSAGLRCNSGTDAKFLAAGQAAANGTMAAQLADSGFNANASALEARAGFLDNFSNGDVDRLDSSVSALEHGHYGIVESGITFKRYPCCGATHAAVDCILQLAEQPGMNIEAISSINICIHESVKIVLIHPRPKTPAEAKFSLEYCICRALLDGQLGLRQFDETKISDPVVQGLMAKVVAGYSKDRLPTNETRLGYFPVEVEISMLDGTRLVKSIDSPRGTMRTPFTVAELEEKFRDCVSGRLPDNNATELLAALHDFEQVSNFSTIAKMLSHSA